jgi:hypothetical protein
MDHLAKSEEKVVNRQNLQSAMLMTALNHLETLKLAQKKSAEGYDAQGILNTAGDLEVEQKKLEAEFENLKRELEPYDDEDKLLAGILKSKFELLGSEVVK